MSTPSDVLLNSVRPFLLDLIQIISTHAGDVLHVDSLFPKREETRDDEQPLKRQRTDDEEVELMDTKQIDEVCHCGSGKIRNTHCTPVPPASRSLHFTSSSHTPSAIVLVYSPMADSCYARFPTPLFSAFPLLHSAMLCSALPPPPPRHRIPPTPLSDAWLHTPWV